MKLHGFPDNPGCRDLAVLILLLNLEVLYLEPQRLCDEETRSKNFIIEGFLWSADFQYLEKSDFVSQPFDAFIKFLSWIIEPKSFFYVIILLPGIPLLVFI